MQFEDQHKSNLRLNLQAQESNNLSATNAELIQSRLEEMNMLEIQIQKLNQSLNTLKNTKLQKFRIMKNVLLLFNNNNTFFGVESTINFLL